VSKPPSDFSMDILHHAVLAKTFTAHRVRLDRPGQSKPRTEEDRELRIWAPANAADDHRLDVALYFNDRIRQVGNIRVAALTEVGIAGRFTSTILPVQLHDV